VKRFAAWVGALAVLAFAATACGSEEGASPGSSSGSTTSAEGLPAAVEETRSAILAAAESGEYDHLRTLVQPKVFLSDFGFGSGDPVQRWQELGPKPLETMGALLRMSHSVRETNEGMLYQWPSYDPDSDAADLSAEDRKLFLKFMTEDELENLILPEVGYTAPRLGILADGTWWFFILEAGA
jgi:hypothetical protein